MCNQGDLGLLNFVVGGYLVYIRCQLPKDFIYVQVLVLKVLVLLSLSHDEIFHHHFEVGLYKSNNTCLSLTATRSNCMLGRIIFVGKIQADFSSRIMSIKVWFYIWLLMQLTFSWLDPPARIISKSTLLWPMTPQISHVRPAGVTTLTLILSPFFVH